MENGVGPEHSCTGEYNDDGIVENGCGEPCSFVYKYKPSTTTGHWLIWLNTRDYVHGTALRLYDNGKIERVVYREDEGDDVGIVKGEDT
jgi:hypothetical protein